MEEGLGAVKGKGGPIHGDKRRSGFGWWAHNPYTYDVSELYIQTYIILLTNVTPINLIKK